jgi:hypothetical protein
VASFLSVSLSHDEEILVPEAMRCAALSYCGLLSDFASALAAHHIVVIYL